MHMYRCVPVLDHYGREIILEEQARVRELATHEIDADKMLCDRVLI